MLIKSDREYMELAVEVMNSSVQEPRNDKVSPKVGAVLIKPDGTVETAYRGELRHGDHAEFALLERKNRSVKLDGSFLYATLEPCAPGARKFPKLSCAERILNARIKKVWIGIEDPDPTVDRKGIKYLIDNDVEVEMFDADLQQQIREANKDCIKEAKERAKEAEEVVKGTFLSESDNVLDSADYSDLEQKALQKFIDKCSTIDENDTKENILRQLGFLIDYNGKLKPTGLAILLFGKSPQLSYPNALIRAIIKMDGKEDIETIDGPLIEQAGKILNWYKKNIGKHIDRSDAHRKDIYDYPLEVIREAIINAIVHRDYDITGAPIYFEINDDAMIIKSPGKPVEPLTIELIKSFNAPSLSRNPKIMYIFDQLGLVEQRGLGFSTIKDLPQKHELPLPIVRFEAPYIIISFPLSIKSMRKLSHEEAIINLIDAELKGYEWIKSQSEISAKEYAVHFDYTQRTASRHLNKMLELGLIITNGEKPKSPLLKYKSIR